MNTKPQRIKSIAALGLTVASVLAWQSSQAAIISKADNNNALNTTTAWVGGVVPGSGDVAQWDSTVTANNTTNTLGANLTFGGLRILNPASPVTLNTGSVLTNGLFGIDLSSASVDLTLSNPITIMPGGLQAWNVAAGRNLYLAVPPFRNQVASDGAVQFSTTGNIVISNVTTAILYDGNNNPWSTYGTSDWVALSSGQVVAATYTAASAGVTAGVNNDILGSFNINNTVDVASLRFNDTTFDTIQVSSSGTSRTLTAHGILVTPNCVGANIGGTAASSFVRASRGSGGAGPVLSIFQNSASPLTIGANVANNNVASYLAKFGPGTVILANPGNGYSGGTFIDGGNLTVSNGASIGGGSVTVHSGTFAAYNNAIVTIPALTFSAGTSNTIVVSVTNGQFNANATYTANGSLALSFLYGSGIPLSATTAPFFAHSNLVFNSTVNVAVQAGNAAVGTYPLVKWTNAIAAGTFANFNLVSLPLRTSGYLSNDTANVAIDLVITNVDEPIKWAVGNGAWDIATTLNWVDSLLGAPTTYQETNGLGDSVVFGDSASGSSPITVTLNTRVVPASVTANGTSKNYTISGSGSIAGPGSLTKSGSSTLALSTPNAFAGGLNLNGGILNFSAITNLGAGAITFNGGTLQYNGNSDDLSAKTLVFAANGSTIDTAGSTVNFALPIAPASVGGLTKTGSGTLTLNGTNTYKGPTAVTGGTLALGATTYISNSAAIVVGGGATLDANSSGVNLALSTVTGQILAGSGIVDGLVTAPAATTISPATNGVVGNLTLNNGLTVNGGTLAMDVSSGSKDTITVNGNLTLTAGTLALNVTGTLPDGSYTLITYSGSLASGVGSSGNLTVAGFSQANAVATLSDATVGQINLIVATSASDHLTWSGTGSTWDPASVGTLDWLLNGATAWAFTNGDIVRFDDTGAGSPSVNLTAVLLPSSVTVSNNAVSYVWADGTGTGGGKIAGSTSVVKDGPGSLVVQTANTYSGTTTVKSGTLQIGNGGIGDIGAGNVTNNGTLIFDQADGAIHTVSGVVSGSGTLTQEGSSATTVALSQNNTFTGGTLISSGNLQVGTGGSTGSLGTGPATNNGVLYLDRSNSFAFTTPVSGTGAFVQLGSGTTTVASGNTYLGNTYVSNGVVKLTASEQIPSGNTVAGSTGWLVLDGSGVFAGTFDLAGFNQTVNSLSAVFGTFNGVITNSGAAAGVTNIFTVLGTAGTTYNGSIADNSTGSKTRMVLLGATELRQNGVNGLAGGVIVGGTATYGVGPGYSPAPGGILMSNGTTYNMHNNGSTTPNAGDAITIVNGATVTVTSGQLGNGFSGSVSGGATSTNLITGPVSFSNGGNEQYSNMLGVVQIQPGGTLRFAATALTLNGSDTATFDVEGSGVLQTRNAGNVHLGALQGNGNITEPQAVSGTGNFVIGLNNNSTTYSGFITGTNSIVKMGSGTLTLSGANSTVVGLDQNLNLVTNEIPTNGLTYYGNTTISNGTLALVVPANLTNTAFPIILAASNAVLNAYQMGYIDVTGTNLVTNGLFEVVAGQPLTGVGSILASNLLFDAGSLLNVGLPLGTLNASQKAELAGVVTANVNATNSPNCGELTAASLTVDATASLIITNLGPQNGATFQLFNHAVSFSSVTLPALTGTNSWVNNLAANGSITLLAPAAFTVNTNATNITTSVVFNPTTQAYSLNLSWPADHTGWQLQIQTNSLGKGLGTNWITLVGTELVDSTNLPVNPNNASVFYRLTYP